jgi:hypothetical protein
MNALKKKAGPLPVWAWLTLAGGTIGVVLLVKRGKGKPAGEGEVPQTVGGGAAGPEVSGSGSGGGTAAPGEETKTPSPDGFVSQPTVGYEAGGFAREANDVREGAEALEALGIVAPRPGASSSPAAGAGTPATAAAGNPRAGLPFKTTTIHGQQAHEYEHSVPGGVGPGKRFVVIGGPAKRTHAAKGSHAPAHARGKAAPKHPTRSTHKPAPRHAPAKPPAAHRGAGVGGTGIGSAKPPARKPAKRKRR